MSVVVFGSLVSTTCPRSAAQRAAPRLRNDPGRHCEGIVGPAEFAIQVGQQLGQRVLHTRDIPHPPGITGPPARETLSGMDDYQIPTTDGRHVTLRYDEQSRETIIHFPPPLDEDDETPAGFEFTIEDAERLADALTAIQTRATDDAAG